MYLVLLSIHLKDGDVPLSVDLVAWGMLPHTLGLEQRTQLLRNTESNMFEHKCPTYILNSGYITMCLRRIV